MEEQTTKLDYTPQNSIINHHHPPQQQQDDDEFNQDFQCCICLDLLYKPVVLACGHLSCFLCVFKALSFWSESHCPICRSPFNYFPNVCQLLHLLLLKLYPDTYERRQKQVEEEEKSFNDPLIALHPHEESEPPRNALDSLTHSTESELLSRGNSEKAVLHGGNNAKSMPLTSLKSPKCTTTSATENCSSRGSELESKTENQVFVTDLLCSECKKLLCHPVVLNCGHVYCESCVIVQEEGIPRCPVCQSLHSNGFPSVCFVLEHFLQEQFPHEYAERINSLPKDSNGSKRTPQLDKQAPNFPSDLVTLLLSGTAPTFHICGCDSCGRSLDTPVKVLPYDRKVTGLEQVSYEKNATQGLSILYHCGGKGGSAKQPRIRLMTPIIGKRYKCKDCVEKVGFDLCENCFINPSKVLGRFNQQHKPDHKFEIVPLPTLTELFSTLNIQVNYIDPEEHEDGFANPNLLANVPRNVDDDGSNNMENTPVLSNDATPDQESEPNSSNMGGEDIQRFS